MSMSKETSTPAPKEADEAITSASEHDVGSSKSVGWLRRLGGRNQNLNEVGKDYFQQSLQYDPAQLERDAVKVCRKLDFYVLPMVREALILLYCAGSPLVLILLIDDDDIHVELPR
jgi:hypothetical protein